MPAVDHQHLPSTSEAVNVLQEIVGDFYSCCLTADSYASDPSKIKADVRLIASNKALPAAIAASLHALLKGAKKGKLHAHDLLLCYTGIMAALTGGGEYSFA
jgi:hypothetical protein